MSGLLLGMIETPFAGVSPLFLNRTLRSHLTARFGMVLVIVFLCFER